VARSGIACTNEAGRQRRPCQLNLRRCLDVCSVLGRRTTDLTRRSVGRSPLLEHYPEFLNIRSSWRLSAAHHRNGSAGIGTGSTCFSIATYLSRPCRRSGRHSFVSKVRSVRIHRHLRSVLISRPRSIWHRPRRPPVRQRPISRSAEVTNVGSDHSRNRQL
jgi:hypothetical protein